MTFIIPKVGDTLSGRILAARDGFEFFDARDGEIGDADEILRLMQCVEIPEYLRSADNGAFVKRDDEIAELWTTTAAEPSDPDAIFTLAYATGKPVTAAEKAQRGLELLREARQLFIEADNKRTVERVRAAISSAKGAIRIQSGRRGRQLLKKA